MWRQVTNKYLIIKIFLRFVHSTALGALRNEYWVDIVLEVYWEICKKYQILVTPSLLWDGHLFTRIVSMYH